MLISFVTIVFMSLLAYSTVYGVPDLANSVDFLEVEGERLKELVGAVVRHPVLGRSARSRSSPPRWASSTTPAGSPPTC